jgi:hypothetical protein
MRRIRRRALRLFCAVTFDEVFALKSHTILNGDATTEGFNPLDVAV